MIGDRLSAPIRANSRQFAKPSYLPLYCLELTIKQRYYLVPSGLINHRLVWVVGKYSQVISFKHLHASQIR